ncbi:MAG: dihydroneopterin aldolase [Bacteroidales bacterium]|jgi:dihydroneopterin aldolase|nr:dihydroneopterin aldolase [Bacteroidales bacterium]
MTTIKLEKMKFYAFHGCFKEENIIGNHFEVDLQIEADTSVAEKTDNVEDTVNYALLYEVVKKEMAVTSKTIEQVASRILTGTKTMFPQIIQATVRVSKLNPAVGGEVERASVTVTS